MLKIILNTKFVIKIVCTFIFEHALVSPVTPLLVFVALSGAPEEFFAGRCFL